MTCSSWKLHTNRISRFLENNAKATHLEPKVAGQDLINALSIRLVADAQEVVPIPQADTAILQDLLHRLIHVGTMRKIPARWL